MLSPGDLVQVWQSNQLGEHQLLCAEAEQLEELLGDGQAVRIEPEHWDQLSASQPPLREALVQLHERLSRQLLNRPLARQPKLAISREQEAPLRLLLQGRTDLPGPWQRWLDCGDQSWTSWAIPDAGQLRWSLVRQPLQPLQSLHGVLEQRGAVLAGSWAPEGIRLDALGLDDPVVISLGDAQREEALPLFAPRQQPFPNSAEYAGHLLDQCRRLVLGQRGLSIVVIDDNPLRQWLTSALAAEFGRRVDHEQTAPESNGVVVCRWQWWLQNHEQLPGPCQLVVGSLPIASLEDPLTAARVEALRRAGRDWFREWLLPDACDRLQRSVAPLRGQQPQPRLAILDGRLRSRSWGQQLLSALEPWERLEQLRPD
jgi:ATP-dependent DNA helicase DinG